ncbi:hypothetical protein BJ684DRAFT_20252 [Piptocephalis cylindrospora]|uniref:phosphoglycerate dehydrogenase n=1 Tax=Piptocephalis cylindrospora TaxID=1907219 RepID=A0A4P9Y368_9FUNG|nr:hypothetical protein BJ684DRAFT_20252 [Piptocephalis cylindrospora]|eukprot:RKP13243.1 hypothetical protein BJ684DRAFT_20252 [Piptocephalis cylindrospora]
MSPATIKGIRALLLENVNAAAVESFRAAGIDVEHHTKALPEAELREKLQTAHIVGIRSKTQLTASLIADAPNLIAIGCFCIGTNQVDLEAASAAGIAVFNSPFSNSRSVAELVIAEIITLSRQLGDRNREMHQGVWNKVSAQCYEIRGKTLGIVGYGHIGTQLSVLAEAMGMHVIFYDVLQLMPLGAARPTASLNDLLSRADVVTLHVPETPETRSLIGKDQLEKMRPGAFLINASRGTVVDIDALAVALRSGALGGAAVDVYPKEPRSNGPGFESALRDCPNTILTPHIGGSTEEAQSAIGIEVSSALLRFISRGSSLGAVNVPEVDLRANGKRIIRVLHMHNNVPGVLGRINEILSSFNVEKQICESRGALAYLMLDLSLDAGEAQGKTDDEVAGSLRQELAKVPETIKTRILS